MTTVPPRDSSARAPRECPHPPRGAGGAGPHPRLTSRATRPSTVLLRLSGSPEACPGSHALACKGPGAMAVQEDAGVSRGTSCQPRPAGHQAGTTDYESQVCRRDTGCGSPVFCPQQARCPGGQRAAQGPQGPCGLTLSVQSKQAPPASKMGGRAQRTACPACCEGQHTGEASVAGRPVLTMRLGKRTSPAGAWQLQSPSPAHGTSCLPPPHQWGPPPPSFCRKRTRAPGVEVTSPRRPECGRGQTRRSKGKGRAVPGWAVVLEAVLAPGAKAWVCQPRTTRISPKHRHRTVSRSGAIVPGF